MPTDRGANTHRRATPAQVRSAITHQKILDAAMELLSTKGLPALNTNAVAQIAGINSGTVYHYFADKNAILREVYFNGFRERDEYLAAKLMELPTTEDVAKWSDDLVRHLMKLRRKNPYIFVLRRAFRAIPELTDLERADNARVAALLGSLLRQRFGLSAQRAGAASIMLVELTTSLLDRASVATTGQQAMVREVVTMLQSYLDTFGTEPAACR